MLHLGDTTFWKSCDLDFDLNGYPKSISRGKLIVHRWLPICVSNKLWPQNVLSLWNIAHWQPNDIDLPFQFLRMSNVNRKAIYDSLYEFHTNFDHMMHHLWDTIPWKVCDLDLTFKCNQRSQGQLKDHTWLRMCTSYKHWWWHTPFLRY